MPSEKKTHFNEKKTLKTLFQEKKHHHEKKAQKHFCFLKTLSMRTANGVHFCR